MGKQRTQVGAYSADNFNDGNQDKIRSVDIGDSLKPNAYAIKSFAHLDGNSDAGFSGPVPKSALFSAIAGRRLSSSARK
jgi:hypothetical protein